MTKLYETIVTFSGNSFVFRQLRGPGDLHTWASSQCVGNHGTDRCKDWTESWTLLNFDLVVALMLLHLLSGSNIEAESFRKDAHTFGMQGCHIPPESEARRSHVEAFLALQDGKCQEALDKLKQARRIREAYELGSDKALDEDYEKHLKHNLTVCSHNASTQHLFSDSPQGLPEFKLCLCCSSFRNLPCIAMDSEFIGSMPDGLVGWQDTHRKLTVAQIKAMGVRMEDVPPRVEINNKAPQCDFIGTVMEDEKDYLFSTMDLIRFATIGTEHVYPPHGATQNAAAAAAAGERIVEVDDYADGEDVPDLVEGNDIAQADDSVQDDATAEHVDVDEPVSFAQSNAIIKDAAEDEMMHDVKTEDVEPEVQIKEEVPIKQEQDMESD